MDLTSPLTLKTTPFKTNRTLVVQQPMREPKKNESYDGPEDAKKIDLAEPREEPKLVYIATYLSPEEETMLIKRLQEYRNIFVWSYKDLKG